MLKCLGIDVGASGALALLDGERVVRLTSMPVLTKTIGGRRRIAVSEGELFALVESCAPGMVVFEASIAMPKQSATAIKTNCENVAFLRGVLTALKTPFVACRPQEWQRWAYAGIDGTGKDRSLIAAQRLFPYVELKRSEHGMADALLMAAWGQRR